MPCLTSPPQMLLHPPQLKRGTVDWGEAEGCKLVGRGLTEWFKRGEGGVGGGRSVPANLPI